MRTHPATLLSRLLLGSSLLLAVAAASAQPVYRNGMSVQVQSLPAPAHYRPAPPPPRREALPHARRGQAWVPGHWIRTPRR